ncbi:hypothetical protein BDP67DRAFT_516327 [Colletotrichum lupini]|nr:hypothetical protein BDP67DRAFT_516327 [Colletotrichum lupini]
MQGVLQEASWRICILTTPASALLQRAMLECWLETPFAFLPAGRSLLLIRELLGSKAWFAFQILAKKHHSVINCCWYPYHRVVGSNRGLTKRSIDLYEPPIVLMTLHTPRGAFCLSPQHPQSRTEILTGTIMLQTAIRL